MPKKVIHVGVGSFGRRWCTEFLAANIADGTIEVVAIVDVDQKALEFGPSALGLPDERLLHRPGRGFRGQQSGLLHGRRAAQFPRGGDRRRDRARRRRPLREADRRHDGRQRSASRDKIKKAGRKMAVTMSHRFDQDKTTLREIIRSGRLGAVNTVSCRYFVRHARAHGLGRALPPHHAGSADDRGRRPSSRSGRRSRRRAPATRCTRPPGSRIGRNMPATPTAL